MANNYLQFSFALKLKSKKEKAWCLDHLTFLSKIHEECDRMQIDPTEHPRSDEYEKFIEDYNLYGDEDDLSFRCDVKDGAVYIDSGESGDADHAAIFAQKFLASFDSDDGIGFSYSVTCDKLRVDEFGGGAFFITKDEMKHINVYDWIDERRRDHVNKFKERKK